MAFLSIFSLLEQFWAYSLLLLSGVLLLWLYRTWAKQSHIPGPFLASISNLPRLKWAYSGKAHLTHISLHEQHGDLVRIGPNCISVGNPREISKIYGIGANFGKVSY